MFSPDKRRTATAVCAADGELLAMSEDKVRQLYFQNPKFGFYLVQLITRRLIENSATMEALPGRWPDDGVQDNGDACVPTVQGEVVNAEGCSIADLCPCDNAWKNHGAYVSCVSKAADDFLDLGLISGREKDAIVSSAARSQCGKKK